MDWVITMKDLEDYKKLRLDRPSSAAVLKYYKGFKRTGDIMYDDEMKDLEAIYQKKLKDVSETQKKFILPSLVYEMKEFIRNYDEYEMVKEKLDNLLAKKEVQNE